MLVFGCHATQLCLCSCVLVSEWIVYMLRARRDFALVVEGVALSRRDQLLPDNIGNGVCVCVIVWGRCWNVKVCCNVVRCKKGARWDIWACLSDIWPVRPWVCDIRTYLYRHPFLMTFFPFVMFDCFVSWFLLTFILIPTQDTSRGCYAK
jgi:hypothetical protein